MSVALADKFTYSITQDGKDVLDEDTIFACLFVKETLNEIPEVELKLMSNNISKYINNCDLEIALSSNEFQYRYNTGIYNCIIDGTNYAYYGKGCKVIDFQEVSSAYLGDDLETAIISLGIKENVSGIDKITGGYWQINETRLNCLYRLMKGVKENSAVVITNDSFKVIDYSEKLSDGQDFICPSRVEYVLYNEFFDNKEKTDYKIYEENNMFNASWRDKSFVGYDHLAFATNLVSSIKNRFYSKILLKLNYKSQYIPYEVGSIMNIELPSIKVAPMRIISKSTKFALDKIDTTIIVEAGEAYEREST